MSLILKKHLQLIVKSLMVLLNRQHKLGSDYVDKALMESKTYTDKKITSLLRTDEETIEMLVEADLLPAVATTSGAVLTDENGNVVLRY